MCKILKYEITNSDDANETQICYAGSKRLNTKHTKLTLCGLAINSQGQQKHSIPTEKSVDCKDCIAIIKHTQRILTQELK